MMGHRGRVFLAIGLMATLCWFAPVPPAVAQGGSKQAQLVRFLLASDNAGQRADAARALGASGDPRVIPSLAYAATGDRDNGVRRAATRAIAQIRGAVGGGYVPGPGVAIQPPPGNVPWGYHGNTGQVLPPGNPYAPVDPEAELIQGWYQHYLRRSLDGEGLAYFANLLRRGITLEDAQANLVASDEYYRLQGGTPPAFVRGLFRDVLNREPSRGEYDLWLRRFEQLAGTREQLAREFFAASRQEIHNRRPDLLYR